MPIAGPFSAPESPSREPWFTRRPGLTLLVVGALFAGVLMLRLLAEDPVVVYSMLYVLPVALAATAFGQRGGLASALLAVGLVVLWSVVGDVSFGPMGWATRVVPILLLGTLLGRATDRTRRVDTERRRLELAALLHQEAIEINDSLVQRMVAAKWALESGQTEAGLRTLTEAVDEAHRLVSALIRRADMGGRSNGTVTAPAPEGTPGRPEQTAPAHRHPARDPRPDVA